jgi:hypothetical protein
MRGSSRQTEKYTTAKCSSRDGRPETCCFYRYRLDSDSIDNFRRAVGAELPACGQRRFLGRALYQGKRDAQSQSSGRHRTGPRWHHSADEALQAIGTVVKAPVVSGRLFPAAGSAHIRFCEGVFRDVCAVP